MNLGDALRSDRTRNLDGLRLVLAIAVVYSHAWPLALGPGAPEPLEEMTGRSLGGWAVGAFFFISGLLITASAERKRAACFWAARTRRIIPGLGMALMVTLALALVSGSTTGFYQSANWLFRAITLVSIEHRLPDAFAANPFPEVVNGPIWSLSHEVLAYFICALFVWAGGTRSSKAVAVLLILTCGLGLAQGVLPGRLAIFSTLFAAFAFGMAVHVWRDQIAFNPALILLCLPLIFLLPLSLMKGVIGFGLVILAISVPVFTLKSDVSYGLYIYGWPVAQAIVALQPGIGPLPLAIWSVVATYPLAFFSWNYVERPVLAKRRAPA